ncbi:MAG: hypothetical protein J0I41_15035 [Filimonas sp.]|nr:hypothetical protein [Filimonas sp.]
MKPKYLLFVLVASAALLATSCGKKKLKEYTVKNEYSISVPEDFVEQNLNPTRFSFGYGDKDDIVNIAEEGDPKVAYEERRTKDGKLAQYPYTLKGFSEFLVDDSKKNKGFRVISHKETIINGMPSVIDQMEYVIDNILFRLEVASVQSSDGKLYRIAVMSSKGKLPYAEDVFASFKVLKQ